jgi:hypothetical protein
MAILDGKRNPDGYLCQNQTGATPLTSTNSVETGREYTMLEITVLASGGGATVGLFTRGSQFMGPAGPVRPYDLGGYVAVTDANNPAAGYTVTSGNGCTLRCAYPRGEYTLGIITLTGATISATYSLTGEIR